MGSASASPDYAAALSAIQSMSRDQLQELLDEPTKLDDYVKSLQQIRVLYNKKEEQMAANKSLATFNLSKEPELQAKKADLVAKRQEAQELIRQLQQSKEKLESKTGGGGPGAQSRCLDDLHDLLKVACSQAEQESDQIAEDFLDNKIESVEQFLEQFMEKRKLYHLRNVKRNKFEEIKSEQIQGQQQNNSSSMGGGIYPSRMAPLPPNNMPSNLSYNVTNAQPPGRSPGGGGHLPYPINPTAASGFMPMPGQGMPREYR